MNQQVFYDPQRKRWKRLRRIFDLLALAGLLLGSVFVVGLMRMKPLPELFLKVQKVNRSAVDFYSRNGFRVVGEESFRVGAREYAALVMRRVMRRASPAPSEGTPRPSVVDRCAGKEGEVSTIYSPGSGF